MTNESDSRTIGRCVAPGRSAEAHPSWVRRIEKSHFTQLLVRENGLDRVGFNSWAFYPGMLFRAPDKWWGDRGKRDNPHEGLDLCLYRGRLGKVFRLDEKTRVSVMYDGVIAGIIADFLGKSIIVEHRFPDCDGLTFLTIYGHTAPGDDLRTGTIVKEGDIIATLADANKSNADVPPHLHVSLGLAQQVLPYDDLDWKKINDPNILAMADPLDVIDGQYSVLSILPGQ